jgi:hypothetical protein
MYANVIIKPQVQEVIASLGTRNLSDERFHVNRIDLPHKVYHLLS